MEAQSIWTDNILIRLFLYLAETYKNYIVKNNLNVYGTRKIFLPIPKIYIVYTGKKQIKKKTCSLGETFFGKNSPIDLKATIITSAEKTSILQQYIDFSKSVDVFKSKNNCHEKNILDFIDKCINKNILSEFLTEHRREIMGIMKLLYDQDVVDEMMLNDKYHEGRQEGIEQGIEQGKLSLMINLVKKVFLVCKKQ